MTIVDPWTELERAGQVTPVSEGTLLDARAALRRAATTEGLRHQVIQARRRRRLRYALAAGLAACVVSAGAVTVRIGDHEVGGSSAAAVVLEQAARAAREQRDPVVGPGQFLEVTLVEQSWGAAYGQGEDVLVGSDGRPEVIQERRTRTLWIPHDIDATWIVREGTRVLRANSADFAGSDEPTRTRTQPSWADADNPEHLKTYDPDWYATLPRDPDALMKAIRADSGAEGSGLAYDFEEIYSEVLRSGLAPAEIRSTLFSALAASPGMVVERGIATLDGRAGVAIGARGSRWQMIFDADTGEYVGERATDPDFPAVPGLDADKTTWLTSVTTKVVDRAPHVD